MDNKSLRHLCTNYGCGICHTNMTHIESLQTTWSQGEKIQASVNTLLSQHCKCRQTQLLQAAPSMVFLADNNTGCNYYRIWEEFRPRTLSRWRVHLSLFFRPVSPSLKSVKLLIAKCFPELKVQRLFFLTLIFIKILVTLEKKTHHISTYTGWENSFCGSLFLMEEIYLLYREPAVLILPGCHLALSQGKTALLFQIVPLENNCWNEPWLKPFWKYLSLLEILLHIMLHLQQCAWYQTGQVRKFYLPTPLALC